MKIESKKYISTILNKIEKIYIPEKENNEMIKKITILAISDTHCFEDRLSLPSADLLLVAGDFTSNGSYEELKIFSNFLSKEKHKFQKIIIIPGNHETTIDADFYNNRKEKYPGSYIHSRKLDTQKAMSILTSNNDFELLIDSEISYKGIKIYGTPWVPPCGVWAFMYDDLSDAKTKFGKIPEDTDILLSHSPPFGILDIHKKKKYIFDNETNNTVLKRVPTNLGCKALLERVNQIKPKLHIFGHIHESSGWLFDENNMTLNINAAVCDIFYSPENTLKLVSYYI